MAIKSRAYLKTRFETNDVPTEQDFIDFLDSFWHQTETPTVGGVAWGAITGTISSQTDLIALFDAKLTSIVADTTPQLGGMLDMNGFNLGDGTRTLLGLTETGSAVNYADLANAATGSGPVFQAAGTDTNIDMSLLPKGTGTLLLGSSMEITEDDTRIDGDFLPLVAGSPEIGSFAVPFGLVQSQQFGGPKLSSVSALVNDGFRIWCSDGTTGDDGDVYLDILASFTAKSVKIASLLGGWTEDEYTRNYNLILEDVSGNDVGIMGSNALGYFVGRLDDGTYNSLDAGTIGKAGVLELRGPTLLSQALIGTGNRNVHCDSRGVLYAEPDANTAWEATDTDTTDFDLGSGTGTGSWVKTGLGVAITETVSVGDRLDMFTSLYVENKSSSEDGVIEIGFGFAGAAPSAAVQTMIVASGFAGTMDVALVSVAGHLATSAVDVWVRVSSGTNAAFGLDVLGSTQTLELLVGVPASADIGVAVGELYGAAIAVTVSASSTFYKVALDTKGEEHGLTVDTTDSDIEVSNAGLYITKATISTSGAAGDLLYLTLAVNGTPVAKTQADRKMGTGGDVGAAIVHGVLDLAANDKVTVMLSNEDDTTNVVVERCNLIVEKQ